MAVTTFGSSNAAGTGGTFASTPVAPATGSVLDSQMAAATQIAGVLSAATFTQDYMGGSTSEAAQFITNGKVNAGGIEWIAYKLLPTSDRISLQEQMITAGAPLAATSVNGETTSASDNAFRSLIGIAQSQNTTAANLLSLAADNGIGPIQQQLSDNIAAASQEVSKPLTVDLTNPTEIEAAANQAWNQTLGYAPSASQLKGMVALIQGQDTSLQEASRGAAQQELTQAQAEESKLSGTDTLDQMSQHLGADGVDQVIAAYYNAVQGLGVPGAGTTTGPVIPGQTAPNMLTPEQVPTSGAAAPKPGGAPGTPGSPGAATPAGPTGPGQPLAIRALQGINTAVGGLPSAAVNDAKGIGNAFTQPVGGQPNAQNSPTVQAMQDVNHLPNLLWNWLTKPIGGDAASAATVPKGGATTAKKGTTPAANNEMSPQQFVRNETPAYGGLFALKPAEWSAAQALTPSAQGYTASNAPESIQLAAFTNLLLDGFQKTGSWAATVEQIASGTPVGKAKGANLSAFANSVASQVNDQIKAAQSQVAAPITTKVTEPDSTGIGNEMNQQAKASDPIGYAAANYSSLAGTISQMLYGSPTTDINQSADTFTGPVPAGAFGSATPAAA